MRPPEIVVSIVAGLVFALGIDLFGFPGLIAVTVVLIAGIARRASVVVLASAIACGAVLALWVLATLRCDPSIQDCGVSTVQVVLFVWLALGLVIGAVTTLLLGARSRPR
ncbi:MAG: hypothetical protein ABI744_03840 [Chloroflexota bacterium]